MREIKNYTTRDWAKQMLVMLCCMTLFMACIRTALAGNWLYAAGFLLGTVGWGVLYFRIMKEIEAKNK